MNRTIVQVFVMSGLFAASACSSPSEGPTATQETASLRSGSGDLDGYEATPFGRAHRACIREVPKGGTVGPVDSAPCAHPIISARSGEARAADGTNIDRNVRFIESEYHNVDAGIGELGFYFTVPPAPAVHAYEYHYEYGEMRSEDLDTYILPTLTWQDAGYYTITVWMRKGRFVFRGPEERTEPGHLIGGYVRGTDACPGGECGSLTAAVEDYTAGREVDMYFYDPGTKFTRVTFVKESGRVEQCEQFSTVSPLYTYNIKNGLKEAVVPEWVHKFTSIQPECGWRMIQPFPNTVGATRVL